MANALQYIANLGKSVTYSAIDQIKDMNPVISEFAEQNSELGKILYESVKDFKGTTRKAYNYAKDSKVGEFGQEYLKALMEDIKTGKLYNRERIDQMTIRASGNLLSDFGDDDPFASMDLNFDDKDSDFDFGDDNWDLDDSDKFMADQIDRVGEKTANAIAVATGRSADYIVKGNKAAINSLQKHNEYLFGRLNVGLGAVNSSIAGLLEFNQKVVKPHVENSKTFFETSNKLDAERNTLLKKLVDIQTNMYKSTIPETKKSSRIKYGDIVSGYSPDLKMYGKRVMQNVNSLAGGYLDMNNMFEGGNMLLSFAGSPLKFITDTLIKKMTPKMIENSMKSLNETLSGFFGSLMSKFNSMRDDEFGIGKFIADIFGIDSTTKSRLDPSRYNKGAIPFDGETKMAITQVIPMHLAKIEAALTGQTERFFDYKKGTFTDLNKLKEEYEGITKTHSERAASDLRSEMEGLLKTVRFKDVQEAKKLREEMSNMFEKSYREGSLINFNKKDISPRDLGVDDYRSFYILRDLMKEVKKSTKMKYNSKVWEQKSAQDRFMESQEADPTSIYRIMESGFNINQYANRKNGRTLGVNDIEYGKNKTPGLHNNLVILKDNLGHNIFHYLQRLTSDVELIRYGFLSGGTDTSSSRGKSNGARVISPISNPPLKGLQKSANFKLDRDIQIELDEAEQAQYDRDTDRLYEKSIKFDGRNNVTFNASSKKIKSGPWTEEQWIQSQKNIAKRHPGYNEEVFMEAAKKVAKKRVDELNKRNSYQKGYIFNENDYDDLDEEQFSNAMRTHIRANKGYEREMTDIDEQLADTKKNTLGRKLKNKLMQSDKVADGFKNLMMGLDDLSQKPVKTISNILNRVDERLYQVIYGDDGDGDGKLSTKSFMGAMMAKMTASFNSFTQFMKDDIFIPFKDMLGGKDIRGHIKDLGNRFLNFAGIDTSKFKGKGKTFAKNMFSSPLSYVKTAMSDVYRPAYNYIKGSAKEGFLSDKVQLDEDNRRAQMRALEIADSPLATFDEGKMNDYYNAMKYIKGALASGKSREELEEEGYGEQMDSMYLRGYAKGTRRIKKTGLAVVSEGEMIVPAKYNPYYHGNKNTNTLLRREGTIQNKFNRAMRRSGGRGDIGTFADGDNNVIINKGRAIRGDVYDVEYDSRRYKYNSDNYYNEPLTAKMARSGRNTFNSAMQRVGLAGKKFKDKLSLKTKMAAVGQRLDELAGADNSDELFNSALKDVTGNIADYIPGVLGGGLVGSGISLITGAIGGPLVGAAVGAATSLITQSDKVKNWLFGEIDEKTGERKGNVISKDLSNNFKKYFPNMAKGATVGGITSILPFVPGGPVAGIIIGSSIGFATKSEKVQSMLFGDVIDEETGERNNRGLFKPAFIKSLKGSIPEMALGGALGVIGGPFGLVGNIALGASLGYLSKTKKFQDALFGKEVTDEKTGEVRREGGILGTIEKKFVSPLISAVQPLGKQLELGVKGIFNSLSGMFHGIFDEELRIPLRKYFKEKIFDRAVGMTKAVGKAIFNPAVNAASLPFRMIGAVGDHFRERQIANGNADYMTAQERLDFRNNKKDKKKNRLFSRTFNKNGGKIGRDNFNEFDQMLVDMSGDDLNQMNKAIQFLENPTESADAQRADSISRINKAVNYDFGLDYGTSKKILKHLRNNDAASAFEVIRRSGLDTDKQRQLSMLISQEYANYSTANSVKSNVKSSKDAMYAKLRRFGLKDINDNTLGKYKKLINQEASVKKSQTPEEWKDNQDQKRHEEVIDLFKELIANIKDISHPENKNVENLKRARFKNNMREASKRRGFVGRFDNGDSGIFSNDYQYDYEVDETGSERYFRYEVDDRGQMINGTKVYVNDLGTPLDPTDADGSSPDNSRVSSNNKLYGAFAKGKSKVGSVISKVWNGSVGNAITNKLNKTFGSEDEADENITYRNDFFGNPIKWVKDKSGRWHKDDADGENKGYEEETKPLKTGFSWIADKIGNLGKDIKDGIFGLFHINEDDGTLKKMAKLGLGGVGILTVAGAANVLENWWDDKAKPAIHDFWQDNIMPRIYQYIEPIQPTLARAAVGIDKAINSIPTAIDRLGTRIRGFMIDDLPRVWATKIIPFYEGGIQWMSEKAGKIAEGSTYLLAKLLPSILKGFAKGAWNLLKGDVFNLFGGMGRRDAKSLLGSASSSRSSSQPILDIDNAPTGGFAENIYKGIFGSNASGDMNKYGGMGTSDTVSDSELEDYYNLKSNTNPRSSTYNSGYPSTSGSKGSSTGNRLNNTINSIFGIRNTNANSFADYTEGIMSSGAVAVNSQTAKSYDDSLKNNSSNSTNGGFFSNLFSKQNNTGKGDRVYDEDGNLYYNNGDGTYINMESGQSVNESDVTEKNGFTDNSVGTRYLNSFGRAALTGRRGIYKGLASMSSKLSLKNPKGILGKTWNGLNKVTTGAFNLLDKTGAATKNLVNKGAMEGTEAAAENAAKELAESSLKASEKGFIGKMTTKIDDFFKLLSKNAIVKKFLKQTLAKSGKEATDGAAKKALEVMCNTLKGSIDEVMEGAAKKAGKAAAKFVPFINIAFYIWDFYDGFNNAASYLGIMEKDTTLLLKFVCGISNLINGVVTLGFVPLSTLIDWTTDSILPFFGVNTSEFKEMQQAAADVVSTYNTKNNTDLSLEEYNKKTNKNDSWYNLINKETSESIISDVNTSLQSDYYNTRVQASLAGTEYAPTANGSRVKINDPSIPSYSSYSAKGSRSYSLPRIFRGGYKSASGSGLSRYDRYVASGSGLGTNGLFNGGVNIPSINQMQQNLSSYGYQNSIGFKISSSGGPNIVEEAVKIISQNESGGNYGTVVANDGGSMSIGKYQFNANAGRAIKVLNAICRKDPTTAKQILGEDLFKRFNGNKSLTGYIPNNAESNTISQLLITSVGMKIQDLQMLSDVNGYINDGKSRGITDPKALLYYADLYHQSPKNAKTVASYLKSRYPFAMNLDNIHQSTADSLPKYFNDFYDRRMASYQACQTSTVTNNITNGYNPANINSGSAYVDIYQGDESSSSSKTNNWFTKLLGGIKDLGNYFFGFDRKRATVDDAQYQYLGNVTNQNTDVMQSTYTAPNTLTGSTSTGLSNKFQNSVLGKQWSLYNTGKANNNVYEKATMIDKLGNPLGFTRPGAPTSVGGMMIAGYEAEKKKFDKFNKEEPIFQKLAKYEFDKKYSLGDWAAGEYHPTGSWSELTQYKDHIKYYKKTKAYDEYKKLWNKFGYYSVQDLDQLLNIKYSSENPSADKKSKEKFAGAYKLYQTAYGYSEDEIKGQIADNYVKNVLLPRKKAIDGIYSNAQKSSSMYGMTDVMKERAWLISTLNSYGINLSGKGSGLSAMGSGFISQLDPKYAYNRLGSETVAKAGCGPATAAMAINGLSGGNTDLMNNATALAQRYKDAGGVKASYFADVFGRAGAKTQYIDGSNTRAKIEQNLSSGKQVVLMGQDPSNRSKANSPFGPGNHYVLAKGLSGNKVLINDPELSGPRVYDKSILNNTKLGIAVSGRGAGGLLNTLYGKISSVFGGREYYSESGDAAVNDNISTPISDNGAVVSGNAASIITYARSFLQGRIKYSQSRRYDIDKGGSYADCSSFVRHVFAKFGIGLGTYTGTQVSNGAEVSYNELMPGDLVMFKYTCSTSNPRGVTHVGIYTGNGMFIHCSSSKNAVVEVPITDKYWQEHWLCGRRVISDISATARGSMLLRTLSAEGSGIQYKPAGTIATIGNVLSRAQSAKASAILSNKPITPIKEVTTAELKRVASGAQIASSNEDAIINKLLATMIKLLSQIADNTDNTKDIVSLLTQILEKAEDENSSSQTSQSGVSGSRSKNNSSGKGSKMASVATSAKGILKEYSQSDKADISSLINDLTSILRD